MNITRKRAEANPTQTMREFFARDDVRALQNIQKTHSPFSTQHREATAALLRLGEEIGAGKYFVGVQ